jgi:hypothetical protein
MRRALTPAVAALLLGGCTTLTSQPTAPTTRPPGRTESAPTSQPRSTAALPAVATLTCGAPIGGDPPPAGFEVVLGVVALPTSSAGRALGADDSGAADTPALFAKRALLVHAGQSFDLDVAPDADDDVAIGWGNESFRPSRRFVVPACADQYGTGWLAYPGGYWVDRPLCLPLTVRAGGREQQVRIGIGTPCPGQQPPA